MKAPAARPLALEPWWLLCALAPARACCRQPGSAWPSTHSTDVEYSSRQDEVTHAEAQKEKHLNQFRFRVWHWAEASAGRRQQAHSPAVLRARPCARIPEESRRVQDMVLRSCVGALS